MTNIIRGELDEQYQCLIHQSNKLLFDFPFHECHTSSSTSQILGYILPQTSWFDIDYVVE